MRAAFYRRTGPAAEVLELGDLPDPVPGPGEVLVRLRASGINPSDTKRRGGWRGMAMQHPLVVPHSDGAGEIVALGAGVTAERLGEAVWVFEAQGGYGTAGRASGTAAELVALPSPNALPLPAGFDFAAGACLGVPAMTAHRAVMSDGPVAGQTVLVQGAAGAVGHFAVQIAVAGGARVIATVSSPEGAAHARAAGAEVTVDRHREGVAARVLELTGGAGVERVIEVDFGANQAIDIAVLKRNGTIASYSSSTMPEAPLPYYDFAFKGATLRFVQGFAMPDAARDLAQRAIADLAARGRLTAAVALRLTLGRIAEAHAAVERGGLLGNVVVEIG